MKKAWLILMVSLLLTATIGVAAATLPDLTQYSTDDLYSLQANIISELLDRSEVSEFEVPVGMYTVGEDLPAGTYTISHDGFLVSIDINDDYRKSYSIYEGDILGKLTLQDGDTLSIEHDTAIFAPYVGLAINKK